MKNFKGNETESLNHPAKNEDNVESQHQHLSAELEASRVSDLLKSKVIFLTDDYGRNMYNYFASFFKEFSVQVICKPFAKFNEVVKSMERRIN